MPVQEALGSGRVSLCRAKGLPTCAAVPEVAVRTKECSPGVASFQPGRQQTADVITVSFDDAISDCRFGLTVILPSIFPR